jgi:reactive intermediate/imine deaminase
MNHSSPVSGLPFSEAVASDNTVYISGQVGIDPATGALRTESFEAEADQVMKNVGAVLAKFGLSYKDLLNVTIYLKTMENYASANSVYRRYFEGVFPSRVCIAVLDLPLHASIEIAAIAQKRP